MERRTPYTHTFKMMYRTNVPFNVTPVSQATIAAAAAVDRSHGECGISCEVKKSMKYLRARMKAKRQKDTEKFYTWCFVAYSQFHCPVECGQHNTTRHKTYWTHWDTTCDWILLDHSVFFAAYFRWRMVAIKRFIFVCERHTVTIKSLLHVSCSQWNMYWRVLKIIMGRTNCLSWPFIHIFGCVQFEVFGPFVTFVALSLFTRVCVCVIVVVVM